MAGYPVRNWKPQAPEWADAELTPKRESIFAGGRLPHAAASVAERAVAALALAFLFPFVAVAGAIVVLLSRNTPLIAHRRVGYHGKTVWVLKLRTMWSGATPTDSRRIMLVERVDAEPFARKTASDVRVTSPIAHFLRRHSIDELPQLWHVVRGEMSFVGPRPLTAGELMRYYGADATEVLSAKPGLTGLWQIKGRSALTYHQRRRLDVFLVRKWSARMYFSILIATVYCVVTGRNAC